MDRFACFDLIMLILWLIRAFREIFRVLMRKDSSQEELNEE